MHAARSVPAAAFGRYCGASGAVLLAAAAEEALEALAGRGDGQRRRGVGGRGDRAPKAAALGARRLGIVSLAAGACPQGEGSDQQVEFASHHERAIRNKQ